MTVLLTDNDGLVLYYGNEIAHSTKDIIEIDEWTHFAVTHKAYNFKTYYDPNEKFNNKKQYVVIKVYINARLFIEFKSKDY